MLDHIGILVRDAARSREFYLAALAPLGYAVVMDLSRAQIPQLGSERIIGFGVGAKPDFWITQHEGPIGAGHVAFLADSRGIVDAFHAAAVAAGGADNGKPGIRELYHPNYYGAFVRDPDGHNIEAVNHKPQ
jgi:catechol 2,3-dioxygenase-like lactoylglutathione lyase family enzyme